MQGIQRTAVTLLIIAGLSACGGGGSSGSGNSPPPSQTNQSPGGIWTSQYTVTSGPNMGDMIMAEAIVSETGQFYYAARNQTNGCAEIGFGQASVSGNSISGNVNAAVVQYSATAGVNTACTYPDGSTSATGTISGTVSQRSSMSLTVTETTSAGAALGSDTESWAFSSIYDETSSLATVAGNYTDGSDTLSIDSNGVVFEQDPTTGCVINGQVGVLDAQYNAYSISVTFSSCMGSAASANGLTMTGLATLDQTVSPAQLNFGISASVSGGQFIVYVGDDPKQ